jgi:F-type H+-transporting ATPase subunit delta
MAHDHINIGYARALLEQAQAESVLGRVEEEVFRLHELLKSNPELLELLKNPNVKPEGKRQALAELFQGRVHPLVLNLLITLSDLDRTGRALPLDDATLQRLTTELSRVTGKSVQLFQKVDPAILGGAVIKVGEQVIDGSLRHKLDQIKESLAQ